MEKILNAVECLVNEDDHHITKEPIGLLCEHCICKECIPKNGTKIACSNCKKLITTDLNSSSVSFEAKYSINENIQKPIEHEKTQFDTLSLQGTGKTIINQNL